jgi:hypothetical protein
MDNEKQSDEQRKGSPVVPGNSGTVPAEKELNPPREGRVGAQDRQPVEGEGVLNRHPGSRLAQKPFPQG